MLDVFSDTTPLFKAEIFSFSEEKDSDILTAHFGILFVLESDTYVKSVRTHDTKVEKGQFVLFSPRRRYLLSHSGDFRAIFIQIPEIESFCYQFFPLRYFRIHSFLRGVSFYYLWIDMSGWS